MAPGPTRTALHKLLEDHQFRLSFDLNALFAEARESAQREFADQLNQAARRLRIAPDADELSATLLDAAAQFSGGSALFRVAGDAAKLMRVRVLPGSAADASADLDISLVSAADQQLHLRAQRFARVQAAEMRLFKADDVQAGRMRRDIYEALRKSIDTARETFRNEFFASCTNMVDYLHLEFTRTLANDDPDLLGKSYPGPLVR